MITHSRCSNFFSMNMNCLQCIILLLLVTTDGFWDLTQTHWNDRKLSVLYLHTWGVTADIFSCNKGTGFGVIQQANSTGCAVQSVHFRTCREWYLQTVTIGFYLAVSHLLYHLVMTSLLRMCYWLSHLQIKFIIPLIYSMETFRILWLYFLSAAVPL